MHRAAAGVWEVAGSGVHFALPGGPLRKRRPSGLAPLAALVQVAQCAIPRVLRSWKHRMTGAFRVRYEPAAMTLASPARGESAAFRSAALAEWQSLPHPHST